MSVMLLIFVNFAKLPMLCSFCWHPFILTHSCVDCEAGSACEGANDELVELAGDDGELLVGMRDEIERPAIDCGDESRSTIRAFLERGRHDARSANVRREIERGSEAAGAGAHVENDAAPGARDGIDDGRQVAGIQRDDWTARWWDENRH